MSQASVSRADGTRPPLHPGKAAAGAASCSYPEELDPLRNAPRDLTPPMTPLPPPISPVVLPTAKLASIKAVIPDRKFCVCATSDRDTDILYRSKQCTHTHSLLSVFTCTHVFTRVHTCVHACVHACVHIRVHACVHACVHTCVHACVHTCSCMCSHMCSHMCSCMCSHMCSCMCSHMCSHTCSCMCSCMHTSVHACWM